MSKIQPSPQTGEQDNKTKVTQPQTPSVPYAISSRWSARRRRDTWFLLTVLLIGVVTIFILTNGGARPAESGRGLDRAAH